MKTEQVIQTTVSVKGETPCELEPIDLAESRDLIRLEKVIERGLDTFMEVGNALAEIRDRRLYHIEHKTFEAYCREKWNIGRTYAHRLMAASEAVAMLPIGNKPHIKTESQARELAKIEPERRAEVVAAAVEDTGGNVTAAAIREAGASEAPATKKRKLMPTIDQGMRLWVLAKTHLDNIIKQDASREAALKAAITYCEARLAKEKALPPAANKIDLSDGLACTEIGDACRIKDRAERRDTLLRLAAFAVLNATEQFTPGMILRNVDAAAEELGKLADKLDGMVKGGAK